MNGMNVIDDTERIRHEAAFVASAEDASLWRWSTAFFEDRRIRWRLSRSGYVITVDRRHVATNEDFDKAIRGAKAKTEAKAA